LASRPDVISRSEASHAKLVVSPGCDRTNGKKPGDRVSFHFVREGEFYEVPVTLVEARK
jgi:hypothetical protein